MLSSLDLRTKVLVPTQTQPLYVIWVPISVSDHKIEMNEAELQVAFYRIYFEQEDLISCAIDTDVTKNYRWSSSKLWNVSAIGII
jgi:hypothetical protein